MALGKILVVDDDQNICELLRLYLDKEGYTVNLAFDGEEALRKFETLHPDLILLDPLLLHSLTPPGPLWVHFSLFYEKGVI